MDFEHANPRISDVLSDSNFSVRINRCNIDYGSLSIVGHGAREILTEVSIQQSESLNNSFVTHRRHRKTKIVKLCADVIKEEPEIVDDLKCQKIQLSQRKWGMISPYPISHS